MNLNPQNESEAEMDLHWMESEAEVNLYFSNIVGDQIFIESCEGEIVEDGDYDEDECERSDCDESMDGDFESGMASAGWGTDEDYE